MRDKSCLWMSRAIHMNVSHHTYEWVMSHIGMSHVPRINESCHTYECSSIRLLWVISHIWETRLTYEWVMSPIWMSHVPHVNESCLPMPHMWIQRHLAPASHVPRMNESCHTYEWVTSHLQTIHVTHVNESCHICKRVLFHKRRGHVTHITFMSRMWIERHLAPASHVPHYCSFESCLTL